MHEVVGLMLLVPVVGLATWQICEIWNHGSIFYEWRQKCEVLDELWWAQLLSCMFCLSNWVALLCGMLAIWSIKVNLWFALPLVMFAGARLANLGNDIFKKNSLTPADDGFTSLPPVVETDSVSTTFDTLPKPRFEGTDFHA